MVLEKRLEGLVTRYYVNKYYKHQGKVRPWTKPLRCLCKHKDALYVHGKYVPCGRRKCQEFVDGVRRDMFRRSDIVTNRKKNAAYWKQMRAGKRSRVERYAHKHGISYNKADLELQLIDIMEEEIKRQMAIESEYYVPHLEEE